MGPRVQLQKASDAIPRNYPTLYHLVTVWLVVRSLHCVCDSYNRIHVLIKDGHEAEERLIYKLTHLEMLVTK